MKPIEVSIQVPQPRERVFEFLDVLANHEPFTDHMMVDWSYSGPDRGVGARAKMRAKTPGPVQWLEMEVTAAQAPTTTTEETVGAGGKRRTRGTYTLADLPNGGTDIRFTFEYLQVPAVERPALPLTRAWVRRSNATAMRRLAAALDAAG